MLQVIGDTIYFNGQPLAVISMPLSGMRIEAIDFINRVNYYPEEEVAHAISEIRNDVNHIVKKRLTEGVDTVWIREEQAERLIEFVTDDIANTLANTWARWKAN